VVTDTASGTGPNTTSLAGKTVVPSAAKGLTPLGAPLALGRDITTSDGDDEDSSISSDVESMYSEKECIVATRAPPERKPALCAKIQAHCWHLPLTFGGEPLRFLIDSGSEVTIVRTSEFHKQPALCKLTMEPSPWQLSGIGGSKVTVHGVIPLPVALGGKTYVIEALVADITTPGVLGMNFFEQNNV